MRHAPRYHSALAEVAQQSLNHHTMWRRPVKRELCWISERLQESVEPYITLLFDTELRVFDRNGQSTQR